MSVRFVFLTDSHYYPGAPKDYGAPKMLTKSKTVLDAIVPAVNPIKPEFIVHGGDFLCGGSSFDLPWETYLQSIEDVATTFADFEAPMYCVPGNHDSDAQHGSFEAFAERFDIPETLKVVDVAPRHSSSRSLTSITNATQSKMAAVFGPIPSTTPSVRKQKKRMTKGMRCCCLSMHGRSQAMKREREPSTVQSRLLETVKQSPAIVALFTGHPAYQPYPDVP